MEGTAVSHEMTASSGPGGLTPGCCRQNRLAADTQTLNQGLVPLRITALQVVQQPAATRAPSTTAPPGVVVLLVGLEMLRQLKNPLTQDGYLNFWRTGVRLVNLVLRDTSVA